MPAQTTELEVIVMASNRQDGLVGDLGLGQFCNCMVPEIVKSKPG
jgi:hypothetical protein